MSGSFCATGNLHHACRKEIQNQKLSDRGEPLSTYSEVGDATDADAQPESGVENTKVAVEERTKKWGRVALKAILIGLCLVVATPIVLFFVYARVRSGGNDWAEELIGLGIGLIFVVLVTMNIKKGGVAVATIGLLLLVVLFSMMF